jgi:hypothetical protein
LLVIWGDISLPYIGNWTGIDAISQMEHTDPVKLSAEPEPEEVDPVAIVIIVMPISC